jgi:hypothetical protein
MRAGARRARWLAVLGLAAACAVAPPPPPANVSSVAVLAVDNRTRDPLAISGDNRIAQWLGRERRTVPDVMAEEAQHLLKDRGFDVVSGPHPGTPGLRIRLDRFDPDLPNLAHVSVDVRATLADADGTARWSAARAHWIVATPNAPSLSAAYEDAAKTVVRDLLDGWQPQR